MRSTSLLKKSSFVCNLWWSEMHTKLLRTCTRPASALELAHSWHASFGALRGPHTGKKSSLHLSSINDVSVMRSVTCKRLDWAFQKLTPVSGQGDTESGSTGSL